MISYIVGTLLAITQAKLLVQGAYFVSLNGPLLLTRNLAPWFIYDSSLIALPMLELWGLACNNQRQGDSKQGDSCHEIKAVSVKIL